MKSYVVLTSFLAFLTVGFGQVQIGNDINGENPEDLSGHSVAVSASGNIVAIGAIENDDGGNRSGHVRVYENVGGTWTQIGQDIPGEAIDDRSGWSLAISANGNIVAIGSDLNSGVRGHVRIYENVGGTWTQIGSDIDGETQGDASATSISLSYNGSIVAIGAPRNDDNGSNTGHVRVYQNIFGTWQQIGQDIDGQSAEERSGNSVALNGAGNKLVIGASQNDDIGSNTGQVKVYENIGGTWTQLGGAINGVYPSEQAGGAVAISEDGNIVAVGSSSADQNGNNSGLVRIFEYLGGVWTQIGSDIIGEASQDYFGYSLALSANGDVLAIGALWNDSNGPDAGRVRVYKNLANVWTQIGLNINGEAASDESGVSVDLSADGNIVAIGAMFNDGNGNASGHVRLYDLSSIFLSNTQIDFENTKGLFPNPSNDVVTISYEGNELQKLELYSVTGNLIFSTDLNSKTYSLRIADYPSGTYLLKISCQNGSILNSTIIRE